MVWRWRKREIIYLSLYCHHQNDSCIKMGSDQCHFNVSVGSDGQSHKCPSFLLRCCFTSTEAKWLIRDGDREGRGRKSEGSTADTARKRPERPWTAARTMEVLRRCPLAIAQRLVHCAIAVSTAVLGQGHKDNVRCIAVDEQLGQFEAKEVQFSQPSSTSLLMISSGLT